MNSVKKNIEENKVIVFSKSTCPFCTKAKRALQAKNVEFEVVELNREQDGSKMQDSLFELTNQRTVPNIFINGEHMGGCDDILAALKNGTVGRMLA